MISASTYQQIVCLLDNAHSSLQESVDRLVATDTILTSIDALDTRKAALATALNDLGVEMRIELNRHSDSRFLSALQTHVQTHYGSVSAFITDNALEIPQYIAELSAELGFTVPSSAVVDYCG